MDLSRFDAAPLIAFIAARETNYGTETDGRIPHKGDGWDILPGLVAFALAVVSTAIQIGFSFSAFFGFKFSIWLKGAWKVVS
ncbi:hypothetical protein [Roseovarius sp. ZX-A-9]|uniref:hypothetical protein n=1 Tax=Roseovarius sp. ZX-A-9 TaxID=3014783 RepID=UPI00232D2584|nr:hypothetical protein [Roseovarius sp. ZX-A-9]